MESPASNRSRRSPSTSVPGDGVSNSVLNLWSSRATSGASFDVVDTSGVELLTEIRDGVANNGKLIWLHHPSQSARRLLRLLALTDLDTCSAVGSAGHR